MWHAVVVCAAIAFIGLAINWKDPPPPSDDDKTDALRTWDGEKTWDEITEGWT